MTEAEHFTDAYILGNLIIGFITLLIKYCCFSFVAGVILRERTVPFERMLWRTCRGNVFLRYADLESIEDPATVSYFINIFERVTFSLGMVMLVSFA